MKKLSIVLVILLCLSLCACDLGVMQAPDTVLDVHITAGRIESGMTIKDIFVEVTFNNEPITCQAQLIGFDWEGNWIIGEDEVIPENFYVRLDVYYTLPKGYDIDDIQVTMTCDGGQYDDTYSVCHNAESNLDVVSQAFYGEEPQPPQEQTEPETQPEIPTETQPHVHNWTETSPGYFYINCTADREVTYTCICGESMIETIPAPGHDLHEWSVTPATCTHYGTKSTSCKRCGAGFIEELPATGHAWSGWSYATGRLHKRVCDTCGAEEEASHNIPSGSVTCTDCGADIVN